LNLTQQIDKPALDKFSPRKIKKTEPAFESFHENGSQENGSQENGSQENGSQENGYREDSFQDLGITPKLMKEINRLGFETPTPIQKSAIPVGIDGDDIIAIARTGSGKTLAFGVPMLQRLAKSKRGIGLVLVPTRELALQVEESIRSISRSSRIRSVVLIGGAPMAPQQSALRKNPQIIIATPGRLVDHLERGTARLSNVEIFVLDEADRMLDMGFLPDIRKVMKAIPAENQMMLFSATMPKEIEAIARKMMTSPIRIEIDRSGITPTEVSQEMFLIANHDKSRLLSVHLKGCSGPALVFTRTKRMATKLTTRVNRMGFAAAEIHSNRSLGQRRSALEGFKRGKFQVLIATDIAARGIDVSGIELVVNYDMPANPEDYVHRIGRTGRAGKTGHAVSFANTEQKSAIRSLERFMKTRLPISKLPILPSEKFLSKEPQQVASQDKDPVGKNSSKRKPEKSRSPKRKDFKRGATRVGVSELIGSMGKKSDRNKSNKSAPKRKTSNGRESTGAGVTSRAPQSNSGELSSIEEIVSSITNYPNAKSYWSAFKKKRLTKKKSVGQGTGRKKRSKRK
jgi:ATP-dependent RNA helicase RhlE